jgi:membrane protein DedA with SNARE-associated domain
MISNDLAILVPWIIAHGYLIFLIIATIEGPLTTVAAGVATSLGYFNLYLIIPLAILADIGGDVIYFYIGYNSHKLIHSRFFRFFGLTEVRIEKTQQLLKNKSTHAVFLVKFSPVIGPFGWLALGAFRPKFKNIFWTAFGIATVKSIFFILLGYYFGEAYSQLNKTLARSEYVFTIIAIAGLIIYAAYLIIMKKITKKFDKEV